MSERDYALGEIDRRMGNVMRFGAVVAVDVGAENGVAQVDLGELTTDWIPWLVASAGEDRTWRAPSVGEQVAVLSPGDPSQGVILGSVFQNAHPANGDNAKDWRLTFKDGTVVEFDRDASVLNVTVNSAGSANVKVGSAELHLVNGAATVKAPTITLDGDATVTGNLNVDGNTALKGVTSNGKNVGDNHKHNGVQTGSGNTGNPI